MRVLMLVATSVVSDARVLREAGTLAAAGHEVHVVGMGVPAGAALPPGVTASTAGGAAAVQAVVARGRREKSRLRRAGRWLLLPEYRALVFGRWARAAHRDADARKFDVVHAHDFNTLRIGSALARDHGVPLVYDSHELWFGRPVVARPTPLATWLGRRTEARLGRSAAAVLTVGPGVARALESRYGWPAVTVVRNTFVPAPAAGAPPEPRRLVYAGRLAPYRELEVVAAASAHLPLPVDLIGPADETWLARFEPGAATVLPPVAPDQATALLRAAGLALVTHSDRWPNHRLAMPNKLFQAVAAGVPVVATDVGELAGLVRRHDLGALYRPGDAGSLRTAVDAVLARYPEHVAAVRIATAALSWPVDEQVLLDVYAGLEAGRPGQEKVE